MEVDSRAQQVVSYFDAEVRSTKSRDSREVQVGENGKALRKMKHRYPFCALVPTIEPISYGPC